MTYGHTHTHTHTNMGEGHCCSSHIIGEEKDLEFAFQGRESSRVPMSWGRLFQMRGLKFKNGVKAIVFQVKRWSLSICVSDEEQREREAVAQKDKWGAR